MVVIRHLVAEGETVLLPGERLFGASLSGSEFPCHGAASAHLSVSKALDGEGPLRRARRCLPRS